MGRERREIMKKKQSMRPRMVHENQNYKRKEVIQMKKREGLRSWMHMMVIAVAVMGMSLLLVQVAGAVNYTITVTQNPGGTISPGTVSVVGNTDKAFTITPGAMYAIDTLRVDGNLVQPQRTYKFTKVTAIHSISATFAPDRDNDGISDYQELNGITLADGTRIPGRDNINPNTGLQYARADRLDPDSKDLFVILDRVKAPQVSKFPANPLEFALKPQSEGGLGFITFHVINPEQTQGDRFLNSLSAQKAARVTESLDVSDPQVLGSSTCGTPDQDKGTVYTQRIESHVNSVYQAAGATPPPSLIATYIKHTIVHELGHMVGPLAPVYNANYGGNHYKSEANDKIMNQFVYYTGTTFYIGTSYTSADQGGIKLK
jgi:hypothetical protein